MINGYIKHSTIAYECIIEKNSQIIDSVLLPNITIGENVYLKKVIVNKGTSIPNNYRCIKDKVTLVTNDNLFEVGELNE